MNDLPSELGGAPSRRAAGLPIGELVLGTLVIGLGLVLFWQLAQINVGPSYSRIGPRLFPGIVAAGLVAIGAGILLGGFVGRASTPVDEFDLAPILWISAGLLAMIALIEQAGFVPAATILFLCVARGFGSRTVIRDLAIGIVLTLACQFGFSYGLGLQLPWGVLSIFG